MSNIKLKDLNIISAGAGSGKTYTVQQTLSTWLETYPDKIRPDKILAVTFTKMAASEMQSRIRAALLSSGNMDAAMKVTSSQISTIHSFGQNIIQSFAYESGMSPRVRQLSEAEEKILLQLSLSSHTQINAILEKLEVLGYKGKFNGSEYSTALEQLQSRVLQVINTLRTIGATEKKSHQYIDILSKEIRALYGDLGNASVLNADLHQAVIDMLNSYPNNMKDVFGGNNAADKALTANYKALNRALDLHTIENDWELWVSLQSLRLTKIKDEDYIELAEAVMDAANKLSLHPGPLEEAILHIQTLLQISIDTLQNYNEEKRKNALIDFSDMVHLANSVMDEDAWIEEMASTYDCLVIDEFQDTNPIQFALLWKFKQQGLPTLIVGDLKQ
jgi:ATP-dependent exoDNAse (exonuclease V) beta subunit